MMFKKKGAIAVAALLLVLILASMASTGAFFFGRVSHTQMLSTGSFGSGEYTITYNLDGGTVSVGGGGGLGSGDTINWTNIMGQFFKVSDVAPTEADLANGYTGTMTLSDGSTMTGTEADVAYMDLSAEGIPAAVLLYIMGDSQIPIVYFVYEDVTEDGITATKGTYFLCFVNDDGTTDYLSTLTINGYTGFGGSDTINWTNIMGQFFKVSDAAPTEADLANGYTGTMTLSDGSTMTGTEADVTYMDLSAEGIPAAALVYNMGDSQIPIVYFVYEDVTEDGITATKGTYFICFVNDDGTTEYLSSLTINGYTGFGGGGGEGNPETYTAESDDITLINPKKPGYTFIGWVGSNGTTPSKNVMIPTGSTGNRIYTAVWEKNPIAYAVYSADDTSLRFYYTTDDIITGEDYNNLEATAVYANIKLSGYTSEPPWYTDGNYANITKVVFEDNAPEITNLGGYFYNCSKLTEITIPDSVTSLGTSAFNGCTSLTEITIPSTVTSIGASAFYNSGLTEVVIPDSVTSLGNGAFNGSTSLTSVTLSKNVAEVPYNCFYGCTALTEVIFPIGVTKLGSYAFQNCTSLEEISFPDGMAEIGYQALYGCTKLSRITLPASVTTIGSSAFPSPSGSYITGANGSWYNADTQEKYSASSIPTGTAATYTAIAPTTIAVYSENDTSLRFYYTLPEKVVEGEVYNGLMATTVYTDVETYGYSGVYNSSIYSYVSTAPWYIDGNCANITNVAFAENVSIYEMDYYFYDCENLTGTFTIPNTVTKIGEYAFSGCAKLEGVVIPSTVTKTGDTTFKNCTSITEITIPDTVRELGDSLFSGCTALKSVSLPTTTSTSSLWSAFYGCTSLTEVTLPSGLESIASLFAECTALTTVVLPDTLTSIDDNTFYNCTSLSSISLPAGLKSLGSSSFKYCTSLTEITIPEGVTSIAGWAFEGCCRLSKMTLPASLTNVATDYYETLPTPDDDYIFGADGKWYNVDTGDGYAWKDIPFGTAATYVAGTTRAYAVYSADDTSLRFYYDSSVVAAASDYKGREATAVYENVEADFASYSEVPWYADGNYAKITKAVFEDENFPATTLAYYFYNCKALTEFTFPEGITTIGDYALYGCWQWNDGQLTIPASVETIGNHAFHGCQAISGALTIPATVTAIGEHSFNSTSISGLWLPDGGLSAIPTGAFSQCHSLATLWVSSGSNLQTIGDSAFEDCTALTTYGAWPTNVKTLGSYAFSGCTSLNYLNIPDSVTSVGAGVFADCSGATEIRFGSGITQIANSMFQNCDNLRNVVIPNHITSIGSSAFRGCNNLVSVDCGASMETIGDAAFFECTTLYRITLPATVKTIGFLAIPQPNVGTKLWYNVETGESYAYTAIPTGVAATYTGYYLRTYAIYSADDNSLRFYYNRDYVAVDDVYNNLAVTQMYSPDTAGYSGSGLAPWYADYSNAITNIVFEDEGLPITSMKWYFYECYNLYSITFKAPLTALDSITGLSYAFPYPDSGYIPGADGKWYNAETSESYYAPSIPTDVAATYVAVNPASAASEASSTTFALLDKTAVSTSSGDSSTSTLAAFVDTSSEPAVTNLLADETAAPAPEEETGDTVEQSEPIEGDTE